MKYTFQKECGAVVSTNNKIISFIFGSPGSVDFPIELILGIHKRTPGYIYKLAHTHPPQMDELSQRDIKTLKTIAFTLYPYPIYMSIIYKNIFNIFYEKTYFAMLEPKEDWEKRGKGIRNFSIELVSDKQVDNFDGELLIKKSYRAEEARI